jgi:deazaflavin-dependent oxidoreductase (nitroreductase family)
MPPSPSTIRLLSSLHSLLYRATGGRLGRHLAGHPVLLLTTLGRRTGRPHRVPLVFVPTDEGWAVVASFGGCPRHPDWYHNLQALPEAEVWVDGGHFPVVAADAAGGQRERLWALAVEEYPGYAVYQQRTSRRIPIVLLRRV